MEKNQLKDALSPYLQQHANNPVHWYQWGAEALEKAKIENKPILLSIGYSACHWCHVMAHESFEDEETANLMNQYFINIKVDREERPDLDKIYQITHQLLNQKGGGWPLTVFLNPQNLLPFFSGTYFPKESRYGLPGFKTVLAAINDLHTTQRTEIDQQNSELKEFLDHMYSELKIKESVAFTQEPIEFGLDLLEEEFDQINGGFNHAPKFPMPSHLQQILRRYHGDPRDKTALNMLKKTLDNMAMGGIYDQIGGGFFRYSVDNHWEIPHFEKMLYDNGLLLAIYAQAAILLRNDFYKTIAYETATWAVKKMRSPEGGFYSTIDADSLGIEGKYYLWDKEEIQLLLTADEYVIFASVFNLRQSPNFEGSWHLHQVMPITALNDHDLKLLLAAKLKLLQVRKQRISPHKDQKILTSWNGLLIRGISLAGFIFQEPRFIEIAKEALYFIKKNLYKNKVLFACYKDQQAYCLGYLDDYAFLLDALLCFLQAEFNQELIEWTIELADECIKNYYDQERSGFYFTAHQHEALIQRQKPLMDDALPSGNAVIILVLNRLGHLLNRTDYIDIAEKSLRYSWAALESKPMSHQGLLNALAEFVNPPEFFTVIYRAGTDIVEWKNYAVNHFNPHRLSLFLTEEQARQLPNFADFQLKDRNVVGFLCAGASCSAPIYDLTEL